jgi:phage shock protein A
MTNAQDAVRIERLEQRMDALEEKIRALEARLEALDTHAPGGVEKHMDEFIAKATEKPDGPLSE